MSHVSLYPFTLIVYAILDQAIFERVEDYAENIREAERLAKYRYREPKDFVNLKESESDPNNKPRAVIHSKKITQDGWFRWYAI